VVVRGCQIWAVNRTGKNSPSHVRQLPHMCTSWCEPGQCPEGGHLSCVSLDELYGCVVAVCLNFPCAAHDVLRS
jgi:hypothetical protein